MRTKPKQKHSILLNSSDLAQILRDVGYDIPENQHYASFFLSGESIDETECDECAEYHHRGVSLGMVTLEWYTDHTEGGAE